MCPSPLRIINFAYDWNGRQMHNPCISQFPAKADGIRNYSSSVVSGIFYTLKSILMTFISVAYLIISFSPASAPPTSTVLQQVRVLVWVLKTSLTVCKSFILYVQLTELTYHSVAYLIFSYSPSCPGRHHSSEFTGRCFWYISNSFYPLKSILMAVISVAHINFTFSLSCGSQYSVTADAFDAPSGYNYQYIIVLFNMLTSILMTFISFVYIIFAFSP